MQLVNQSYLKCIDPQCEKVPTIVFSVRPLTLKRQTYTVQVVSCSNHAKDAENLLEQRYPGLICYSKTNPVWLDEEQRKEALNKRLESKPVSEEQLYALKEKLGDLGRRK